MEILALSGEDNLIDQEKKEKIRQLDRNFNNEWMVQLWEDYHFSSSKKYKFLYYDPR